jgi:hypothetical membrane protein
MRSIFRMLKYAGAAAAAVYIVMTLVSALQSSGMGPLRNWLSDYGSPFLNPGGAVIYNAGCIATALLLAAFYIGMTGWHKGAARKYVVCYICAEVSGLLASCFLILASVFPIGTSPLHPAFSLINMIATDCFLVFTAIAALLDPYVSSGLGVLGIIAAAFNIFTANVFEQLYIGEWLYFGLFIIYTLLITYNYERFRGENLKEAEQRSAGAER